MPAAAGRDFPQAFSHLPLIDTALRLTASRAHGGGGCRQAA
jgi:hypothetical protein